MPDHTSENKPTDKACRLDRPVGRPVFPETDCEDQGFSSVSEGCNVWPCNRTPLVKWRLGWRCPKCGGCY